MFSTSVFSAPWYFRGRPNFGVLGDLTGFAASRDLITRARTSREFWPFLAFPLFRGEDLIFFILGVIYMAFLKNYPIPQGFVLPNEGSSKPLQSFTVSVDKVEELTGLDFFSEIPQPQQEQLERTFTIDAWKWQ